MTVVLDTNIWVSTFVRDSMMIPSTNLHRFGIYPVIRVQGRSDGWRIGY